MVNMDMLFVVVVVVVDTRMGGNAVNVVIQDCKIAPSSEVLWEVASEALLYASSRGVCHSSR